MGLSVCLSVCLSSIYSRHRAAVGTLLGKLCKMHLHVCYCWSSRKLGEASVIDCREVVRMEGAYSELIVGIMYKTHDVIPGRILLLDMSMEGAAQQWGSVCVGVCGRY